MIASDYRVEIVPIADIKPSPENDDVYGTIERDEQMDALIESISNRGLEEPIIVTADNFIVSGHRRHFACGILGLDSVPVRRKPFNRNDSLDQWHRILAEYNPQRIKTAGTLLKEAMLRHRSEDARDYLLAHCESATKVDAEFTDVEGYKFIRDISEKKQQFLASAKTVVESLRKYWPLSVRQIHYQLLNDPPLISTPKRSKFSLEHYRYRNDKRSYKALVELVKQARYAGEIPMHCIDDPTRPQYEHRGFSTLSSFIEQQMNGFLMGYHRDRQLDQPRHIEVLGEKNTLLQIIKPVCREYYVPLTLARGYGVHAVWRDIAARFKRSGKDAMTLIVASDYDPEGLDLAKDAIRSLRDLWGIGLDYHRVGVTRGQIDDLGLANDPNPVKEDSTRVNAFIEETGGEETWELECLPPDYLQDRMREAIESNMDLEIYEQTIQDEQDDADDLNEIREQIIGELDF